MDSVLITALSGFGATALTDMWALLRRRWFGVALPDYLVAGPEWAQAPTLAPALIVGVVSVAAPWLLLQPGMGAGLAARRTPRPYAARLHSLLTHTVFGFGLYLAACAAQTLITR